MKNHIGALALIGLTALATPAMATQLLVSVTGTLISQGNDSNGRNTGIDPNLYVGADLTLTASFDSSMLIPWGNFGYSIVGLYGLGTTGDSFFRIDAPNMTWKSTDDILDGMPFYKNQKGGPGIIIQGDKVIGLIGVLSPANNSTRPEIRLGSSVPHSYDDAFRPAVLSSSFSVESPNGAWNDFYNSPGFGGVWDFANSSVVDPPLPGDVAAVPEPATWSLLIAGFGLVGATMRRRSLRSALHV